MFRNVLRVAYGWLFILNLYISGCGSVATPSTFTPVITEPLSSTPSPIPIASATTVYTATSIPFPVNAEVMDQAFALEASSVDLLESLAPLWPSQPWISDMDVLPGQSILVLGYSEPSGRLNAAPGGRPQLVLWNLETNAAIDTIQSEAQGTFFNSVAVSPDGSRLAYVGTDRLLIATRMTDSLAFTSQEFIDDDTVSIGYDTGAAFSPDNGLLAIMDDDGDILLWDVQSGRKATSLSMTGPVISDCSFSASCIAFTPDGHQLLAARGQDLRIWNLDDLNNPLNISVGRDVISLAVSRDGSFVLTGNDIGEIQVWDLPDGKPRLTVQGHNNGIRSILFSPDGRLLASSSHDTIVLWNTLSWTAERIIDARFYRLAFTSDGKFLVTAAIDERGQLWGVRSDSLTADRQGVKVIALPGPVYLESWTRDVPVAWLVPAGSVARHEIRLESSWKVLESCAYSGSGISGHVARQQPLVTASLLDLETSAVLATRVFEGGQPEACPESLVFSPFNLTKSLNGGPPDADQFLSWLRGVMAPLGYP
jgi:hypothetical protein